ncbi:hypothetical protein CPC16_004850 [Podila verticillata]|nr:hypothetical protein CPC16_004850 [Podila verticillata]
MLSHWYLCWILSNNSSLRAHKNVTHQPDDCFGLVVFECAPKRAIHLATAQHQSIKFYHDNKIGNYVVSFQRLKGVQDTMIIVNSKQSFKDSLPNSRQEAEDFVHNRSKDVVYWTLSYDCHNLVSASTQLQTYQLTATVDFEMGHLCIRPSITINLKDKEQIGQIINGCHDLGLVAGLWKKSEHDKARGGNSGQVNIVSRVHPRMNHFMTFLRHLGLGESGSKYVPWWFHKESTSVRKHFLSGLIDANGCCEKQEHIFVTEVNGSTPHDCDKSSQHCNYKGVPIGTIYPKIADGVFVLAQSLSISYSVAYKPGLCAMDLKWQPAPVTFTCHHIECRYGAFHQDIIADIHKLPDLPLQPPQNPVEITHASIQQLESSTLKLIAKIYCNFGLSHQEMNNRLGVLVYTIAAYFANKGNNKKLDNLLRDQVFEMLPLKEIH